MMKLARRILIVLYVSLAACLASPPAMAQAREKSPPEALQIYSDAASFQNNKVYDLAVEEWTKFLTKFGTDPLAPKAWHYLGVCYLQLEKPNHAKAIEAFETVIKQYPNFELLEDTYLNLGSSRYALAGQGKKSLYAKAAEAFAALVEKFPADKGGKYVDQALYFQADSLYLSGKKKESLRPYTRLVNGFPDSPLRADALYGLGVAYEELEQYPNAGKVYDIFLQGYPDHDLATEVRMRKAETMLQTGSAAQAEKIFAEVAAVKGFASADHAIYRQAACAVKLEAFDRAAKLYATISEKHPSSVYVKEATREAGRCYYRAGQYDEAATWLSKAIAGGGKEAPEAAHWLCRIYLAKKQYDQAAKLAAETLPKAEGSKYLVHLKLDHADALFGLPDSRTAALTEYVKIATDYPEHELAPQALYDAVYAALEMKQYDAAVAYADSFLKQYADDPLRADVKYLAAECDLLQKKYPEAEKLYRDLVANYPEHADLAKWQLRLALVLSLEKKPQETVDTLTGVIATLKSKSQLAEAQFLLGTADYDLGQYAAAAAALEASLEADPKWEKADQTLLNLSRAQYKLDKVDDAKATAARLVAEFPASKLLDRAHFQLAQCSYRARDYEEAANQYDLIATKWPKSVFAPHALYGRGWSQLQLKAFPDAIKSFTALLDGYPDHPLAPETYDARATCRQKTGDFQGGIADVDAYLKSNPKPADKAGALYVRALCEVGLKDYKAAVGSLEAALAEQKNAPNEDKVLYELAWAQKSLRQDGKAAAVFGRLAADHPDSPLAAESHYHVGEDLYNKRQYAEAAESYTRCRTKAKKGELIEKALYKLGWSLYKQAKYEPAMEAFVEQVRTYKTGSLAADGVFMAAECLFKLEDYERAYAAYQKALAVGASSENIEVLSLLHGGQSAGQLEKWEEAVKLLARIPEKHPTSDYVAEALYEQGWANQNLGQLDEALPLYESAAAKSRTAVGARARFMMGEVYFTKKQYAEATREFLRAMFGYGGEKAPNDVKPWQSKAGYEAARCAEVQIKDAKSPQQRAGLIAKAREYYTYVVEKHPNSKDAPAAKKRLAVLDQL